MRLNREVRQTVAQFLNSLAVGFVATLILAPLAGGNFRPELAIGAAVTAAICHGLALRVARRSD